MDLILDTHALFWLSTDHPKLSPKLVVALSDPDTRVFASAVTAWEYQDLALRGRFPGGSPMDELQAAFGIATLDYPAGLWQLAASLPDLHRDPIDRMLIAHAIAADMVLVTADETMRRYPVKSLW